MEPLAGRMDFEFETMHGDLVAEIKPFIAQRGWPIPGDDAWLEKAVVTLHERAKTLVELVDFASFDGKAELERYPPAGGANPVVHVFVVSVGGGQPNQMNTGSETDQYIPRVNWLPDSKHVAIQRLNRAQTSLDLMIADVATGASRVALTEKDQYWINVSDDLRFLQDGQRFLFTSERSGFRHIYLYNLEGNSSQCLPRVRLRPQRAGRG